MDQGWAEKTELATRFAKHSAPKTQQKHKFRHFFPMVIYCRLQHI
jgi:hypothetical protein